MYLRLAWRNLWRNKRRTIITMASVFFAVILSTLMMSMKEGVYVGMIDSMVGAHTGYAQVHLNGYWDDQVLDNSLTFNDTLEQKLDETRGLVGFAPRIESFGLTATEKKTRGSRIVGIDPSKELIHSQLNERVFEGEYLEADDRAVLVGADLAEFLEVGVGDTLIVLGKGYHDVSAAGKYKIKGLVKFGSPDLSKRLVFLPIKEAQWLYDLGGMYTTIVLVPENPMDAAEIVGDLGTRLGPRYEVMTWQELTPDLINMIETDRVEGYIFMAILYLVIAFGIFGTMLMMLAERMHEFGVLVAVGMKRLQLSIVVFLEVLSISILGAFFGMLAAFPICAYFYSNPIELGSEFQEMTEDYGMEAVIRASIEPGIFIQQAIVVATVACVIAIYPFIKINRLDAITAMRT